MFESGAIVLHIAEKCEALMPADTKGRARTTAWMFAALNSVEPPIDKLAEIDLFHSGEAWTHARRPMVVEMVQKRLGALEDWLDGRDYLEGRFTAGDLLMTTVLRILRHTDIVSGRPSSTRRTSTPGSAPARSVPTASMLQTFQRCAAQLRPIQIA